MEDIVEYFIVDSANRAEVELFERAFYLTYVGNKSDSWAESQYIVHEEDKRVEHSILKPEEMRLYLVRQGEKILGGGAINLKTERVVTFEELGVKILEEDRGERVAEGLNLFLNDLGNIGFYKLFMELSVFVFSDLKELGFRYLYGKCPEKLINMYGLAGFEEVEHFSYKGNRLCLVKADI